MFRMKTIYNYLTSCMNNCLTQYIYIVTYNEYYTYSSNNTVVIKPIKKHHYTLRH